MRYVTMRAKIDFKYGKKDLKAGDKFLARFDHALLLTGLNQAVLLVKPKTKKVSHPPTSTPQAPMLDTVVEEQKEPKKRGRKPKASQEEK